MDKRLSAEQLRRALQLLVASLTEDKAMEIASVYPAWETTRAYAVGDIVSYGTNSVGDPQLYKVVQAHTSQADWAPDAAPALYDAFGLDDAGYPLWAQPSGAHDAYNVGDIVNYNGTLYESIISGNVWSPDVYPAGWQLVESGGGQTLCRYVYDPAKTVENTLTVYSLEESALVRQTIAEWNTLHPETRIEYTVGMTNAEGTGATREDVIRQLNTELLAGTGPDLLILDGLAGDSLIRQGLLTDLTGLADWSAVRENVRAAYAREDGLYAVPMGMRAYIVGGRPDTVDDRLLSLSGIADAMEESGEANACLAFSGSLYEQIFDLFYPASADAIWRDGQFQPDAYTRFTEQLNRIARAAGAKTIQASTSGENPEMEGAANVEFYTGYSAGTLNNFWNGEGNWFVEGWDSAMQATAFSLLQRDAEGRLTGSAPGEVTLYPMPGVEGKGVLEPLCAASLPVNGKNQALALDFMQLMLSDTVQSAAGLDALPVTESGLAAALDRVRQIDPFTVTNDENTVLDSLTAVIPDTVLQAAAREAAARLYDGELTPEAACQAVEETAALRLAEQS